MGYGIIENGVVANAVEADAAFADAQGWIELTGGAGIGWGYKDGAFSPPSALGPDMPALRQEALATAMAYGNAITAGEINQWAGVEPISWTQQRDEAKIVREGGTLTADALLPGLAEDKGVSVAAYADDVWGNYERYARVLRAAVYLRRTATTRLLDEALDTPEALQSVVDELQVEADQLAAQLLAADQAAAAAQAGQAAA